MRQEIAQQFGVVRVERVLGMHAGNKVRRNQFGALVDQLVKGVLAVGAGFAPNDGPGGVVDAVAVSVHRLAVGLHVRLLQVGCKTVQVLVVGQDGVAAGAQEVAVPNAQRRHEHGDVLAEGGFGRVEVDPVCPV